ARSTPLRAVATGSPTPLPGSGAQTGTPARSPTTCSWVTAFGRCRSAATSSGVCPCSFSQAPSFPASVVLPAPCRPASRITVGGCLARVSSRESPPRISISCSCTILTICWAGFSDWETSAEEARSRTAAVKARTAGTATSASSRARRIWETVVSMSDSDSRPLPRRDLKVAESRSERLANTGRILGQSVRCSAQDICTGPGCWPVRSRPGPGLRPRRPDRRAGWPGRRHRGGASRLQCVRPVRTGADPDHVLHHGEPHLAVADLPGAGGAHHQLGHRPGLVVGDQHLDAHLGQQVHGVLRTPVDLG